MRALLSTSASSQLPSHDRRHIVQGLCKNAGMCCVLITRGASRCCIHVHSLACVPACNSQDDPCRYSKLRMWDMADEFDQLLYIDYDTLALGRIEVALDYFVQDGTRAPQPLGAVRNQRPDTQIFNAGAQPRNARL